MEYERMHNKEPLPTFEEIRNFIGGTALDLFDQISAFMDENYDFEPEISYGGKNYGVIIKYRKSGKTLLTILPEKDCFDCVLVYGKKEIEKFENRKNEFDGYINTVFADTKQFHDGKWLQLRFLDAACMDELTEMIKIKKKPNKKKV